MACGGRTWILAGVVAAGLAGVPPCLAGEGETVDQAVCRLIEAAARTHAVPVGFFARLIWKESTFRADAVSHKGAQGIAQFMPGTAAERGLADPFDPETALPAAARLIADHARRFGNLGLAAAAYNAGPARVDAFLAGRSRLPAETRGYILAITGRSADDWAAAGARGGEPPASAEEPCLTVVASLRRGRPGPAAAPDAGFAAELSPWGIQVAGAPSKAVALAAYRRQLARIAAVFGDANPMIVGTRLAGRGRAAFYRVRMPAQTREEANAGCARLRKSGGACIVLAN
ncbi:lytic transglycosylase domain-containing protein [Blastochloris viridis]|uniref:Soluble lytic murein transglycosylase n=1 Tax=Blastochloris viridis TaxID=1079 RepID=A0A0H5BD58_BLAVI|nr:lytic transglycosylase domain-containing protein [Blastochloris viridis]ALK09933.1 Transglycosylase SLT domain protein [Blastochloris viridis]BAS00158.1 transglycosylase SLT domain protein [Blastochloris viridis]CUU42596.1 Soluble lytic murein transglycosylase precursor [Blastochloris viridis]